jgi:hypothetical protein
MAKAAHRQTLDERTPEDLAQTLHEFARSDRLLLSPERMRDDSGKWVAAHADKVVAAATDLDTNMGILRAGSIPIGMVAIRFIAMR